MLSIPSRNPPANPTSWFALLTFYLYFNSSHADLYLEIIGNQDISSSLGLSLQDVPKTVEIINDKTPHVSSSTRIEDYVEYIPGVQSGREQAGIGNDVIIRGFSSNGRLYKDGLIDNQNLYIRDPSTIESVEIIKGHDSVLFGSGTPGGTVNYLTKKPVGTAHNLLKIGLGYPDTLRMEWDSTGSLNARKNLQYRFITMRQEAETGFNHVDDDRLTLMPSLRWFNDTTHLTVSAEYSRQQRDFDFDSVMHNGQPVYGVSYVDPRGKGDRKSRFITAELIHQINHQVSLRLQGNHVKANREERLIGYSVKLDEDTLEGFYREVEVDFRQASLKAELSADYHLGATRHRSLVGYESNQFDIGVNSRFAIDTFRLDILNPEFNFDLPTNDQLTQSNYWIDSKDHSYYWQQTMHFSDEWLLKAGLRQSNFKRNFNRINRSIPRSDSDALSSSIGLSWKPSNRLTLYTSRSESYRPNSGRDSNDHFFDPKEAIQYEAGFRFAGKTQNYSAATYKITQDNLTTTDPTNREFDILAGEREVKGLEFKSTGKLNNRLTLGLGYSYMQGEITKNNDGYQGNTPNNIPKHSGSINLEYTVNKLTMDLGAVYVSERQGDLSNSFTVPAYTRFDLNLSYPLSSRTKVNLSVKNLFDKNYVANSFYEDLITIGYPRRSLLSIEHQF